MSAKEIASALASRAEDVAAMLLPGGKRMGKEYKSADISGGKGGSLSVCLSGNKAGVWSDFSTGQSGDLLDLWVSARNISVTAAMAEASKYLGIKTSMPTRKRQEYKRPEKPKCQTPKSKVREWLLSRGIMEKTMAEFKIGEQLLSDKQYAIFPFIRDGEIVNAKYRNPAEKKDMRQEAGAEPCLFGWHLIDPNSRSVAICEGEIDCMTLHQAGIPALSVNAGAGNHQWIDNDWDRLEQFSDIVLCYDNDPAGKKGAEEVSQRLGLHRCRFATFGDAKDVNEYLLSGFGTEEIEAAIESAESIDPDELKSFSDFEDDIISSLDRKVVNKYPALRFGSNDDGHIAFRPGEVSIWTGINGHGKSMMLNQVLIGLAAQGISCCIFSGEMLPARQGERLVRQLTGMREPSDGYAREAISWMNGKFWIFNLSGSAKVERLLEVFLYGFRRYGITHFVIDSMMTTDVPEDGAGAISAQKEFMAKIAAFARDNKVHVHLVAHPRKQENEAKAPGKMDVAGSGHLTNAADNVFSVWSARKEDGEDLDTHDAMLELHKQRNGDTQHKKILLYFNKDAQQFVTDKNRRAFVYLESFKRSVDNFIL